jgi:hypothetical protein
MVVEEVKRRQISPQASQNKQKRHQKCRFPALFWLKIAENAFFRSKVLNKIYFQEVS